MSIRFRHSCCYIFLLLVTITVFAAAICAYTLATIGPLEIVPINFDLSWFNNTIEEVTEKYRNELTPVYWTSYITFLIYPWQMAMVLFLLALMCFQNEKGDPLYRHPPLISRLFLISYSCHMIGLVAWVVFYDKEMMSYALWTNLGLMATLILCLIFNCKRVNDNIRELSFDYKAYLIANRILVQNCITLYLAWLLYHNHIILPVILQMLFPLAEDMACLISISALGVIVLLLFIMENSLIEIYFRYIFMHWYAIIWCLGGTVYQNWDLERLTSLITLGIAGASMFFLFFKKVTILCRMKYRPLVTDEFMNIPFEDERFDDLPMRSYSASG